MNKFFLILIVVNLSGFAASAAAKKAKVTGRDASTFPSPTPTEEVKYNYELLCLTCTESEKQRIQSVKKLFQKLIESPCHKEAWASFKRIDQTNGMTGLEIAEKVEKSKIKNIPLHFYWPKWYQSKSTIGYTYPSTPDIWLNRSFRLSNAWTVWSELSNVYHEALHKIGFSHDSKATERRPYSVPYRGNRVVEYCEGRIQNFF